MVARSEGYAILERMVRHVPLGSVWRTRIADLLKGGGGQVGVHLAVFVEPFLEAVLDGRKTIESRFALHRCAPYGQVQAGDVILLKRSGGPVVGVARAGKSDHYQLGPGDIESIRLDHAEELFAVDDEFWEQRAAKRYATLIGLEDTARISEMHVEKRDRRGWVAYGRAAHRPTLALT